MLGVSDSTGVVHRGRTDGDDFADTRRAAVVARNGRLLAALPLALAQAANFAEGKTNMLTVGKCTWRRRKRRVLALGLPILQGGWHPSCNEGLADQREPGLVCVSHGARRLPARILSRRALGRRRDYRRPKLRCCGRVHACPQNRCAEVRYALDQHLKRSTPCSPGMNSKRSPHFCRELPHSLSGRRHALKPEHVRNAVQEPRSSRCGLPILLQKYYCIFLKALYVMVMIQMEPSSGQEVAHETGFPESSRL